jgi:hypothetical protein
MRLVRGNNFFTRSQRCPSSFSFPTETKSIASRFAYRRVLPRSCGEVARSENPQITMNVHDRRRKRIQVRGIGAAENSRHGKVYNTRLFAVGNIILWKINVISKKIK